MLYGVVYLFDHLRKFDLAEVKEVFEFHKPFAVAGKAVTKGVDEIDWWNGTVDGETKR
jgi:hypothetical protein